MRRPLLLALIALLLAAPAALAQDEPFPRGFEWGVAIAPFQNEPGPAGRNADTASDWWAWVHDPANIAAGRVTADRPEDGPGYYSRYGRDHALAANGLRLGAFRLGIEWGRIFPRSTVGVGGNRITSSLLRRLDRVADQRAVRHYRAVLRDLRRRGLTPFVTASHFSLPGWIHDPIAVRDAFAGRDANAALPPGLQRAGWLDAGTVTEFRKYAAYLAYRFGDLVDYWTPLNEPLVVVASGYFNVPGAYAGNFPPGILSFAGAVAALRNLEAANTAAYDAISAFDDRARIGLVQNMIAWTPASEGSAQDVLGTRHADYIFNRWFLNAAVRGDVDADGNGTLERGERRQHGRKADFIGVNYYFRGRVTGTGAPLSPLVPVVDFLPTSDYRSPAKPDAPACPTLCSDFGSELYPLGLSESLKVAGRYGLPVYVTENGIADADDDRRPQFLVQHLREIRAALAAGVRVRGYFHWTLVDDFEWAHGYTPQFGLYTKGRTARGSARIYARIARRNLIPRDLVSRYAG